MGEQRGKKVADDEAGGDRAEGEESLLAEQNASDFEAREPQYAETGEFVAALGKRDARAVVDDAKGDDGGESDEERGRDPDRFAEGFPETREHRLADRDAGH